jgi:hypothetical protein
LNRHTLPTKKKMFYMYFLKHYSSHQCTPKIYFLSKHPRFNSWTF